MASLTQDLSIDGTIVLVDGPLLVGQSYHLEDEIVLCRGSVTLTYTDVTQGNRWRVARGQDGTTQATHSSGTALTLAQLYAAGEGGGAEQNVYVQTEDPGAVGESKIWIDYTADPPTVYRRTAADDGWIDLLETYTAHADVVIAGGVGARSILQGGENLEAGEDGGDAWLWGGTGDEGNALGAQVIAGGGTADGHGRVSFRTDNGTGSEGQVLIRAGDGGMIFGSLPDLVLNKPEVPAAPTEQDIVDALVTLGLVTQAAP